MYQGRTGLGSLLTLVGALLGLTAVVGRARADERACARLGPRAEAIEQHPRDVTRHPIDAEEGEGLSLDRARLLELLVGSTCILAPDTGSYSKSDPPMVNRPPDVPQTGDNNPPPDSPGQPGPPGPPVNETPEPGGLISGLLGTGLLGLLGWRRRRKQRPPPPGGGGPGLPGG
jgi:LPXTG-motif cell wall-anchored protein